MVWYNPITWFQSGPVRKPGVLYCDNSQCHSPIKDKEISYSPQHGEIYHPGECQRLAVVARTFRSGGMHYDTFEAITPEQARELLKTEKLAQSGGLEQKL